MKQLPSSPNSNRTYHYYSKTLYFVNDAQQVIELESYETTADARETCWHRNNYLEGVGGGATELTWSKLPNQYLPANLNREVYLKLFSV